MKRTLLFLALTISGCGSIGKFTINYSSPAIKEGDAFVVEQMEVETWSPVSKDTVKASRDGFLEYTGKTPDGRPMNIYGIRGGAKGFRTSIFADKGDRIVLTADEKDPAGSPDISGGVYDTPPVAEYEGRVTKKLRNLMHLKAKVDQVRRDKMPEDTVDYYINKMQAAGRDRSANAIKDSLAWHLDSEYGAYLFTVNVRSEENLDSLLKRYDKYSPKVRKSEIGRQLGRILEVHKSLLPGESAPDFNLTDIDGNPVSLSSLKGKWVLIHHWGYCPGTQWIEPRIKKIHSKYSDRGLVLINIAKSDVKRKMPKGLKEEFEGNLRPGWTSVLLSDRGNEKIIRSYDLLTTPTLVLIDPEGKMACYGFTQVLQDIRGILNKNL